MAAGVDRLGGCGMITVSMASDAVDGEDGAAVGKAAVSTGVTASMAAAVEVAAVGWPPSRWQAMQ